MKLPAFSNLYRSLAALAKTCHSPMDRRAIENGAVWLERAGCPEGAGIVRAALPQQARALTPLPGSEANVGEWLPPRDTGEVMVFEDAMMTRVNRLLTELQATDRLLAVGIDAPNRILFVGASGTGKTMLARWLALQLGLPLLLIRIDCVLESFLGATGKNLKRAFEAAALPCVMFLDEIDGVCGTRGGEGKDVAEMGRVTSALLQQLDLLPPDRIVIAATNHPELVDPALRRRLPNRLEFPLPGEEARRAMIAGWWSRVDQEHGAIDRLVAETDGQAPAELRARAMELARRAVLSDSPIPSNLQ